jgi:two-component system, NarL family, sensor histidine kinase BarA
MVINDYPKFAGYHVEVAHNSIERIEPANRLKPDLILMDVQMPVTGGLEATRIPRSMAEFRTTPIVALTAHACVATGSVSWQPA